MIDRRIQAFLLDPEACRSVPLRIEVYKEGGVVGESKAGSKVDRSRRLPDAALLVYDRYCSSYLANSSDIESFTCNNTHYMFGAHRYRPLHTLSCVPRTTFD